MKGELIMVGAKGLFRSRVPEPDHACDQHFLPPYYIYLGRKGASTPWTFAVPSSFVQEHKSVWVVVVVEMVVVVMVVRVVYMHFNLSA